MNDAERKLNELLSKSLTGTKPYFISDTAAHSDLKGYAIQAIEDTVIAAITSNSAGNTLVGETIKSGHVWYMHVYSITLTSGAIFIHRD